MWAFTIDNVFQILNGLCLWGNSVIFICFNYISKHICSSMILSAAFTISGYIKAHILQSYQEHCFMVDCYVCTKQTWYFTISSHPTSEFVHFTAIYSLFCFPTSWVNIFHGGKRVIVILHFHYMSILYFLCFCFSCKII